MATKNAAKPRVQIVKTKYRYGRSKYRWAVHIDGQPWATSLAETEAGEM